MDHGDKPSAPTARTPRTARRLGRRTLLRAGAVAAVGGVVATRLELPTGADDGPRDLRKVVNQDTCVGCTGCTVVCPVSAIAVTSDKPRIDDARCIRCGYCEAVCPVAGLRVSRED